MFFSESRHSVSLEVISQGKYLFLCTAAQCLAYYFSVYDHDEGISWASTMFVYATTALVYSSFHRMKVARVKLSIQEGESEWTSAVFSFTACFVSFCAMVQLVDRTVHKIILQNTYDTMCMQQSSLAQNTAQPIFGDHAGSFATEHPFKTYYVEKEMIYNNMPSIVHFIFFVMLFLNFVCYVFTTRFGNAADDRYASSEF